MKKQNIRRFMMFNKKQKKPKSDKNKEKTSWTYESIAMIYSTQILW